MNYRDYLTDSVFHGLRTLLGSDVIDVNKRHFMYQGSRREALANGFNEVIYIYNYI